MSPSVFLSFFFIVVGLPVLSWAASSPVGRPLMRVDGEDLGAVMVELGMA